MRSGPLVGRAGKAGGWPDGVTVVGVGVVTCVTGLCAWADGFVAFGVDRVVGGAGRNGTVVGLPGFDTGGVAGSAAAPECVTGDASLGSGTPSVCAIESVMCWSGSG